MRTPRSPQSIARFVLSFLFPFILIISAQTQDCNCPVPAFVNPPGDTLVECANLEGLAIPELAYANGETGVCAVSGTVPGSVSGAYNICGGTIVVTWSYADTCGNVMSHTQNISVLPAAPPSFIAPPSDISLLCGNLNNWVIPDLAYSNGGSGMCDFTGAVPGEIEQQSANHATVTWTLTDPCGSIIAHTQTITLIDDVAPQFESPPPDIQVGCLSEVPAMINLAWTDNCDGMGMVSGVDQAAGTSCPEVITRTWSYMDAAGNTATTSQVLTISDDTPPVFISPPSNIMVTSLPPMIDLAWTDNCDGSGTVVGVDFSDGGSNPEIITRTWTYVDFCGNSTTATQVITLIPENALTITCPTAYACSETEPPAFETLLDFIEAGGLVTSACEIDVSSFQLVEQLIVDNFECPSEIYVYAISDTCGNTATCELVNSSPDTIPPVWTSSPTQSGTAPCDSIPEQEDLTAMDDCGYTITKSIDPYQITPCGFEVTYRWSLVDDCGNSAPDQTMTFIVEPFPDPVFINLPADTTLPCSEAEAYIYPNLIVSNGGSGSCSIEELASPAVTPDFGECGGHIEVVWSYTDECDRTIEHAQFISVIPASPPSFVDPPADMSIGCLDPVTFNILDLYYTNGESGACEVSGIAPGILSEISEDLFTITWSTVSSCGDPLMHLQQIMVNGIDEEPPQFEFVPDDMIVQCVEDIPAPISLIWADNCDGEGVADLVADVSDGNTCPETIMRLWGYTDAAGNTAQVTQVITVIDDIPPEFLSVPSDITVNTVPPMEVLSWSDNCDGFGTAIGVDVSDGGTNPEVITRSWTVTDDCGNIATTTQIITVKQVSTGVADLASPDKFRLLPNPARSGQQVLIYGEASISNVEVRVMDLHGGELVHLKRSLTDGLPIELDAGLEPGVYYVVIVADDVREVLPLVVVR